MFFDQLEGLRGHVLEVYHIALPGTSRISTDSKRLGFYLLAGPKWDQLIPICIPEFQTQTTNDFADL